MPTPTSPPSTSKACRRPEPAPLVLAPPVVRALAAACNRDAPSEAAGFLLGIRRNLEAIATEILSSTGGPGEFEIPDHELCRVRAWGEDRDLVILALFHSHPSGSLDLSAADRAALRHSEWPWLVVAHRPGRAVKLALYRQGDARRMPPGSVRLA